MKFEYLTFLQGTFRPRIAWRGRRPPGFSLVEIVVALGIVSVGLVGIMGLLPAGLGVFRQSLHTTVQAQIAQQIINDAQLTPYNKLISSLNTNAVTYYYDEAGGQLAADNKNVIYTAAVSLSGSTASLFSSLPKGVFSTLVVQITNKAYPQNPTSHSFILVKN